MTTYASVASLSVFRQFKMVISSRIAFSLAASRLDTAFDGDDGGENDLPAAAAFYATSFSAVSDVVTPAASHSFISSFRSPYIRISAAISDAFPLTSVWIVFGLPFIL